MTLVIFALILFLPMGIIALIRSQQVGDEVLKCNTQQGDIMQWEIFVGARFHNFHESAQFTKKNSQNYITLRGHIFPLLGVYLIKLTKFYMRTRTSSLNREIETCKSKFWAAFWLIHDFPA